MPPADLASRKPAYRIISAGEKLPRFHRIVPPQHPMHFGKTGGNRWDAPTGEYGVLYAGLTVEAAFAETFLRDGITVVSEAELKKRGRGVMTSLQELRLVDLTGPFLVRIGATASVVYATYNITHAWSLALFNHPDAPDGLFYNSRHDPDHGCAAIFDRAADKVGGTPGLSLLSDGTDLGALLNRYGVGLVP